MCDSARYLTRQQKRELERHPPSQPPESITRRALRMLVQSLNYIGTGLKAVVFWIWGLITVTNVFRLFTLLSVGYLVYDRVYETDASISVQASDPNDAFEFPFSINNNSHLFSISNIHWNVIMIHALGNISGSPLAHFGRNEFDNGTVSMIDPGRNLNLKFDILSPTSPYIKTQGEKWKFTDAELELSLVYDVNLFGLYNWTRHPTPTRFTWIGDATNPQWIRGAFAKPPVR